MEFDFTTTLTVATILTIPTISKDSSTIFQRFERFLDHFGATIDWLQRIDSLRKSELIQTVLDQSKRLWINPKGQNPNLDQSEQHGMNRRVDPRVNQHVAPRVNQNTD